MKKFIISFLLAAACSFVFMGCAGKERNYSYVEDYVYNSIDLYYVSNMIDELKPLKHTLAAKTTTEQVEEVLSLLFTDSRDSGYKNPFDDNVQCLENSFNNSILSLNFNSEYLSMDKERELLGRAAIVLSLLQIDGVSYVNFNIDSQPLTDSAGRIIGNMNRQSFADVVASGESLNSFINLTLYYADESGNALIPVSTTIEYDEVESVERLVVEALIDGPESLGKYSLINASEEDASQEVYPTLEDDIEIVSVSTKNGICYVDFDEEFIKQNTSVDNDVIIYSLVNSLCELNYVNQVQISVLGDSQIVFHGAIELNDPFIRNLNIVKG